EIERLVREYANLGIDQRRVDERAAAGVLALDERGQDSNDRIDAGHQIGDWHARAGRLAVWKPGEAHEAAHPLRHEVVTRPRRIGTGLSEAGHRAIDQPRKRRREARIVKSKFLEPADLEVLDQHIRACRKLFDQSLAFRRLEVEFDGALAAIGAVKI